MADTVHLDELTRSLGGFSELVAVVELLREPDGELRALALEDARSLIRSYSDEEELAALVRVVSAVGLGPNRDPDVRVRCAALELLETLEVAELGRVLPARDPAGLPPIRSWPAQVGAHLVELLRAGFDNTEPDIRSTTVAVATWLHTGSTLAASPLCVLAGDVARTMAATSYYDVVERVARVADNDENDAAALTSLLVLRGIKSADSGAAATAALWRRFPEAAWSLLRRGTDGGLLIAARSPQELPAWIARQITRALASDSRGARRAADAILGARARAGLATEAGLVASLRRAVETRPIAEAVDLLGAWHAVAPDEAGPALLRCMDAEHARERVAVVLAAGHQPARQLGWRQELLTRASHDPDASVRLNTSMVLRWLVEAGNHESWIASAQAAAAR